MGAVRDVSAARDVLGLADISTDGAWLPVATGPDLAAGYHGATGRQGDGAAVGWSVVAARLALTRGGRPLPPGGVLLGMGLRSRSLPPHDGRFAFRTTTEIGTHRSGRPLLRAEVRLRTPAGRDVAEVTFTILWPGD